VWRWYLLAVANSFHSMFCFAHIHHWRHICRAYKNEHFYVTRFVFAEYSHTSNWTWNENFLPLCIHGLNMIKSPHEQLQYFNYKRNLKRFYTWAWPVLGIYLKNLDIIPDIIFDIYWISKIVIVGVISWVSNVKIMRFRHVIFEFQSGYQFLAHI